MKKRSIKRRWKIPFFFYVCVFLVWISLILYCGLFFFHLPPPVLVNPGVFQSAPSATHTLSRCSSLSHHFALYLVPPLSFGFSHFTAFAAPVSVPESYFPLWLTHTQFLVCYMEFFLFIWKWLYYLGVLLTFVSQPSTILKREPISCHCSVLSQTMSNRASI